MRAVPIMHACVFSMSGTLSPILREMSTKHHETAHTALYMLHPSVILDDTVHTRPAISFLRATTLTQGPSFRGAVKPASLPVIKLSPICIFLAPWDSQTLEHGARSSHCDVLSRLSSELRWRYSTCIAFVSAYLHLQHPHWRCSSQVSRTS
jgi:hypothetical protein